MKHHRINRSGPLSALMGAAGACLLALAGACGQEPAANAEVETAAAAPEVPVQQFFDYRLIESEAGVRQWILQSVEMQQFSGQRDVILVDVHMDFFREGVHFSVLTADSGAANLQTKHIRTWGDVEIVTDDGRRLETSELYFDNGTQLIHNTVFNRFTRQDDVMTGIGLEATPDLEYIELKQDVTAEVDDAAAAAADGPSR